MDSQGRQLGFFDADVDIQAGIRGIDDWPEQERFPLNLKNSPAEKIILQDLSSSHSPLLVTGYTSLDYLIDFLADLPTDRPGDIRLLVGSEPTPARRGHYGLNRMTLPQEVLDYWLNAGISLRLCYKIVLIIDMLESGRVQSRYIPDPERRLHSKIYLGDYAVTLGSSNFSYAGLRRQLEANVRFQRLKEPKRYREAACIAENLWALGEDYNPGLLDLLYRLLQVVSWQEALGRACAELLEGDWAQKYIRTYFASRGQQLWPSQKVGIAQAMWMVENVGSVLIADATGAGKTRMGAHLLRAVMDRIWSTGRMRKDMTALVCPPGQVAQAWQHEATECGLQLSPLSHGILSRKGSDKYDGMLQVIRRAQSLAIDEAHNFLNQKSFRTRSLLGNMADVVVMFTATPINRGVRDLLMIVDLLGADNLEDSALVLFDRLARRMHSQRSGLVTTRDERLEMQKEVQRFTLRRTKTMLNTMVDRRPEDYRDEYGRMCRYPEHLSRIYVTEEMASDRKLARHIRRLAAGLRGLINLRSGVEMPEALRGFVDDEVYIRGRLQGAKGLALYHLMSRLRSSRAALIEHLLGTRAATAMFDIEAQIKAEETGQVISRLEAQAGQLQTSTLAAKLPDWLTDAEAHRQAVAEEVAIYREILGLAEQMSDRREQAKAEKLAELLKTHRLVIAFDSCLITLEVMKQLIDAVNPELHVIVATGARENHRKKVNQLFRLGSEAEKTIALCSDAMSEGLNLQQASAVLLLDMPSVIRIAEQRVGRVDRMDSPHRQIEVWWPKDSSDFSLQADQKFYQRYTEVKEILGSNLSLPEGLIPEEVQPSGPATAEEMIQQLQQMEKQGRTWDGLQDAFEPVRDLVSEERGLVPEQIYADVRASEARILSTLSLVRTDQPWAFMAISGADHGAPKWIFLESPAAAPVTHLETVTTELRHRLSFDSTARAMDQAAAELIEGFLNRILVTEISLLPRKKQRALHEMQLILGHYLKLAQIHRDEERLSVLRATLDLLDIPVGETARPDLDAVAEAWLDLIRDLWYEKLTARRRIKPLRLKDIRRELKARPLATAQIARAFEQIPSAQPIHTRVVAAIVGVPD